MRMWNVNPEIMCNKHLLGEHVEMHMFVGAINKNKSIRGYIENDLVEVQAISHRHKALVNEMKIRGFNHRSFLPRYRKKNIGNVNSEKNLEELKRRCKNCRRKIILNTTKK